MYRPSSNIRTILAALKKNTRTFHNRLVLYDSNGNIAYYVSDFSEGTVTENANGSDNLSMGSAVTNEVSCKFIARSEGDITTVTAFESRTTTPISGYYYLGKRCAVECGVISGDNIYYIPLGKFTITEATTDDEWKTVQIKGYDIIGTKMTEDKLSNTSPSNYSVTSLITAIKNTYNISSVKFRFNGSTPTRTLDATTEYPKLIGSTMRDVLAQLAGVLGCNARMDTEDCLVITFFTMPTYSGDMKEIKITEELQWQNGFKKLQNSTFTLSKVTSNNNESGDDTSFTAGSGLGIAYSNDLVNHTDIHKIAGDNSSQYGTYEWMPNSYQPCEVSWRGNPCIEAGDIIKVCGKPYTAVSSQPSDWSTNYTDYYIEIDNQYFPNTSNIWDSSADYYKPTEYTCYIAKQVINFCGGFKSTITCPLGDEQIDFDSDEVTQRELQRTQSTLQQQIIANYNKISGAMGGYVLHLDLDTQTAGPDNLFITDKLVTEADFVLSDDPLHPGYHLKTTLGPDRQPTKVIRMNYEGIGISSGELAGTLQNPFIVSMTGEGIVANTIYTGVINPGEDTTFDLDNKFIRTGTTNYYTEIRYGCISQHLDMAGYEGLLIGQFIPVVTSAGVGDYDEDNTDEDYTYYEGIYFDSDNAAALSFGYIYTETVDDEEETFFNKIMEVRKSKSGNGVGGYITVTNDDFSAFVAKREWTYTDPDTQTDYSFHYEAKFGCGKITPEDIDNREEQLNVLNVPSKYPNSSTMPNPNNIPLNTYYGVIGDQEYLITDKIDVSTLFGPSGSKKLYPVMRCTSYAKWFVKCYFLDENDNVIGSPKTIKFNSGNECVWSNWPDYPVWEYTTSNTVIDIPNNCVNVVFSAQPEGTSSSYWIAFDYLIVIAGVAFISAPVMSIGAEVRNNDAQANDNPLARVDIYRGIYEGNGVRFAMKQNLGSTFHFEFFEDGIISESGKVLTFESDGLYYGNYRLAFADEIQ